MMMTCTLFYPLYCSSLQLCNLFCPVHKTIASATTASVCSYARKDSSVRK